MSNSNNVARNDTWVNALLKAYMITALCIHALFLILYLFGTATFYGKTVGLFGAFEMTVGIFTMGKAFYRGIFGTGLGVLYIVFLVYIIIDFVGSARVLSNFFKKEQTSSRDQYLLNMDNGLGKTFFRILALSIACSMVKESEMTGAAICVLVFYLISYLASRLLIYLADGYTIGSTFVQLGYTAIFVVSTVIIFSYLQMPAIENVITAIRSIFSGFFVNTLVDLAIAVAYITMTVFALQYLYDVLFFTRYQTLQKYRNPLQIAYTAAGCAVTSVAMVVMSGMDDPMDVVSVIVGYLPLAIAAVAMYFSLSCNASSAVRRKVAESADEQLYIGDGEQTETTEEVATAVAPADDGALYDDTQA